jgi:hypothetical protein
MGSRRFRGSAIAKSTPRLLPDGRVLVASKLPQEQMDALKQGSDDAVRAGDLNLAEARLRKLVRAAPTGPFGRWQLGRFLVAARRFDEGEAELKRALRLVPLGSPIEGNINVAVALSRLAGGDYSAETLRRFEFRWSMSGPVRPKPAVAIPEWDGKRPGKLVIFPEQGIGDQIQMARFAPWLQRQGWEVVLAAQPASERLFRGLGVEIVETGPRLGQQFEEHPRTVAEQWVADLSLLQRTGLTLETLPKAPYLPRPLPKPLPVGARFGVVSCTTSGASNAWDRSMPDDASLRLLTLPGAINLRPEATGARDLADTAAIIAGLDLVVTIDTAVAHLAGAMGKPVWILLPWFGRDWRWLRGRTDSPWYPSARLYEQPRHQDWHGLLDQVIPDLAKELGSGKLGSGAVAKRIAPPPQQRAPFFPLAATLRVARPPVAGAAPRPSQRSPAAS